MLRPGDQAPEFSLPDQHGNAVTLASLLGSGRLVLFFYPADFTPVCTREACMVRDHYSVLARAGISIAGVSPDDSATHARFADQHQISYPLLADPDKRVIRAYGVDGPLGVGVRRGTFVIDASRSIQAAVRADFRVARHRALIERALATES